MRPGSPRRHQIDHASAPLFDGFPSAITLPNLAVLSPMARYLPDLADLVGLATTWLVAIILMLAGAALIGQRTPPEVQIGVGWGALCVLLTVWSVLVPLSLAFPAGGFILMALSVLAL